MKTKRVGWCVALKGKKYFKPDILTGDETREDAITLYHPDRVHYNRLKRQGKAKTIPV